MCTVVGGDTPMTFVSGIKGVTVQSGGSGYVVDKPSIRIVPPSGVYDPATAATATVITNGSKLMQVTVTNQGSGYLPIRPSLSVNSVGGIGASLTPLVDGSSGIVGSVIVDGGLGYSTDDVVVATRAVDAHPAYRDAIISVATVDNVGAITGVRVSRHGSGYQDRLAKAEVVSSVDNTIPYPLGAGFSARVMVTPAGSVSGVVIDSGGEGYADYSPYLVISDPGSGATTSVLLSGDSVSSVVVNTPGTYYTANATGTVHNPPTAPSPTVPAVVSLVPSINTFGTDPGLYYQTWAGLTTNKPIQLQMNSVVSYFTKLGYSINIISNPTTGSTILWKVCW